MTKADADQFLSELAALAELLAEPFSEARALGYFETLAPLPLDSALWALREARRRKWFRFPQPGELLELLEGRPEEHAALAWRRLLRAVEQLGTGASVDFGDPALHAAIEAMGGWPEMYVLERCDGRELGFRRAEFVRFYLAFAARAPARVPAVLLGHHAIRNRLTRGAWTHGLDHVDPVVAIGPSGDPGERRALHQVPARPALPSGGEEEMTQPEKREEHL